MGGQPYGFRRPALVLNLPHNGWQYGKWRFAECVTNQRGKSMKLATMPELPLSPPFAILRVMRFYFLKNPDFIILFDKFFDVLMIADFVFETGCNT